MNPPQMNKKICNIGITCIIASIFSASAANFEVELISDPTFFEGVTMMNVQNPEGPKTTFRPLNSTAVDTPLWDVRPWNSRGSFVDPANVTLGIDTMTFSTPYQYLKLGKLGDGRNEIVSAINGLAEWNGIYRQDKQPWPHQIIGQGFAMLSPRLPSLQDLSSLTLEAELKLLKANRNFGPSYNENLHAAMFVMYLIVANISNPSEYAWFGVTFYDDRGVRPSDYDGKIRVDSGKENPMLHISPDYIPRQQIASGVQTTLELDILPHIKSALQRAWAYNPTPEEDAAIQPYLPLLPSSQKFSDYCVRSMTFGWEVTGLNDVSMRVRDSQLVAKIKIPDSFEFGTSGDTQGWYWAPNHPVTNQQITGDVIKGTTTDTGAQLKNDFISLNGYEVVGVSVRMKASSNGTTRLYWANDQNSAFTTSQRVDLNYAGNNQWQTLFFECGKSSAWNDREITRLRLDPINVAGANVEIDRIRPLRKRYEFDVHGELDGWYAKQMHPITNFAVVNGAMKGTTTDGDPQIINDVVSLNGSKKTGVSVRLKSSANSAAELFWANDQNAGFATSRKVNSVYNANNQWQTLFFDCSGNAGWTSREITQIRFDPTSVSGANFEIDRIRFIQHGFEFDSAGDLGEWRNPGNHPITNLTVASGAIKGTSTDADPQLINEFTTINGSQRTTVNVRLKASANGSVQLYWSNDQNTGFADSRKINASYTSNNQWQTVTFNCAGNSAWTGREITALRIDPISVAGAAFEIDWVRVQ